MNSFLPEFKEDLLTAVKATEATVAFVDVLVPPVADEIVEVSQERISECIAKQICLCASVSDCRRDRRGEEAVW